MTETSAADWKKASAHFRALGAAMITVVAFAPPVIAADDDDARDILKAMSDYLAKRQTISFTFDSSLEVITPEMEKIQFTSSGEALVSRPGKLHAHRHGGYTDVELFYDGNVASILDRDGNRYIQFDAPGTLDDLFAALRSGHGVALPGPTCCCRMPTMSSWLT